MKRHEPFGTEDSTLPDHRRLPSKVGIIPDHLILIQRGAGLDDGFGSIMFFMVIDMDETRLETVPRVQAFLADRLEGPSHLNPSLNLHRLCSFAKAVVDAKGHARKT